jgi:hypothetical protein
MPAFDDSYHITWTKADRRRIKRDRAKSPFAWERALPLPWER